MKVNSIVKGVGICVLITLLCTGMSSCRGASFAGFVLPGPQGGSLQVETTGDTPVSLTGRFRTALYSDQRVETSFFLSDTPIDDLLDGTVRDGQIVHVDLLWAPRAGYTPIEDTATNASIRYIIFVDGQVGIYGGAGFARLRGKPGNDRFGLTLRAATLSLIESTDGFHDLLTPATLTGSFNARLDNHMTRQMQNAVSQRVTNTLGRSRLVDAQEKPTDTNPWALVSR